MALILPFTRGKNVQLSLVTASRRTLVTAKLKCIFPIYTKGFAASQFYHFSSGLTSFFDLAWRTKPVMSVPILALVLLLAGVDSEIGHWCGQSIDLSSLPSAPSEVPGAGDSVWRFDVVTCSMVDALMPRSSDLAVIWYLASPHTRATLVNTEAHLSRKRARCSSDYFRQPVPAPRHPTSLR